MNSCSPSHARVHRSNCDAKACIDKYGVCMYVTKSANYISKPEKKSKQYEDLLKTKLVTAEPGAAPHASIRSALFDICKRDYGSQETAAIALNHRSVSSSHDFVHCAWGIDTNEAHEGDEPGRVQTRWNNFEVYLNRMKILEAKRPKSRTKGIGDPTFDAMSRRVKNYGFLEFYKYCRVEFDKSSKTSLGDEKRFTI